VRRFENHEEGHDKFWEVDLRGSVLTTRWGRVGASAQQKSKDFGKAGAAETAYEKIVGEKLKAGYREVSVTDRAEEAEIFDFEEAASAGQWNKMIDAVKAAAPKARRKLASDAAASLMEAGGPTPKLAALLDLGADVNSAAADGSLLDYAAHHGNLSAVKLLIERKADLHGSRDWSSGHDERPLGMAAAEGRVEIVKALVDAGADPNAGDWAGMPPIQKMLFESPRNMFPILKLLTEAGANLNKIPPRRMIDEPAPVLATLLLTQLEDSDNRRILEMVEYLLKKGADPNGNGYQSWTPLHLAARGGGSERLIEILLKAGADPKRKDDDGMTPAQLAADDETKVRLERAAAEMRSKSRGR
jgi:ankyrin repeat protein/predicted DNA-binding WGR domain protein